jgi:hypothetical protein
VGVLTRLHALLLCVVGRAQVFNEKTPLDDDAKPQDSMGKGLQDKLNWMKVGRHKAWQ